MSSLAPVVHDPPPSEDTYGNRWPLGLGIFVAALVAAMFWVPLAVIVVIKVSGWIIHQ